MAIVKFIATVVLLALLVCGGILGYGWTKAVPGVNRPVADVHIALTPDRIARGRHVAEVRCVGCHSRADSELLQGGAEFPLRGRLEVRRIEIPDDKRRDRQRHRAHADKDRSDQ